MMKWNLFVLSIVFGGMMGCSGNGHDSADSSATATAPSLQVILITDIGGMGDKGFNDAGWAGCEEAKRRLAERGVTIETRPIESREQTDYIENLNMAAERADVVIALGFLIADAVKEVASHNPNKSFVFIDGRLEGDNIASFDFRSQEGGFLAGLLAAYMTQTGTVAVLPGMDIPPVEAFASGYRAGVKAGAALQNKPVDVLSMTVGSFNDPVKAKSMAQTLLSQNADILIQLAGLSGVGVIEAVKEHSGQAFAIGVDINQDDMAPGKVLTSVLKRMDRVVADQIVAVYDKKFSGGIFDVGFKEDYVGLTNMEHTLHLVPDAALEAIKKARYLIAQGGLTVPRTLAEVEAFQVPVDQLKTP